MQNKKLTNRLTDAGKITTWEWVYQWLVTYKKEKSKATTYDSYMFTANKHIKDTIGDIPLGRLTSEHLQSLYNSKLKDMDKQEAFICKLCDNEINDPVEVLRIKKRKISERKCTKCKTKGELRLEKGLSIRTIHYISQILNGALSKAVDTGKIDKNPNAATELPPLEYKDVEPFTADQMKKFLKVIKADRHYQAIKTSLKLGLRLGELISLRWSDIDFEKKILDIKRTVARIQREQIDSKDILEVIESTRPDTKTVLVYMKPKTKKSESAVMLSDKLIKELKSHKAKQNIEKISYGDTYKDSGLIFCNQDGGQLDPKNFREHYQVLLKQAGLPDNCFHALRHTFGTLLLESGERIEVISELLRHESVETTKDIYAKVTEKLARKSISKMDSIIG